MESKKLIFLMVLSIVAAALITILLAITGIHWKTSENGEHTGQVTAIDKTGIFVKTWDVYFKSDAQSSQEDIYCVTDENIVKELQEYQRNKTTVTLKYYQWMMASMYECNLYTSSIIIYDVVK